MKDNGDVKKIIFERKAKTMNLRSLKRGSLVVRNLQKATKVDTKLLKNDVSFLQHLLGISAYDTSVLCLSKKRMQNLNMKTRGIEYASEVLSFPYLEDAYNGRIPVPKDPCDFNLGDIYLCPPLIEEKCHERGISLHVNMVRYVAHSLCHLMGYRHDTDRNWKIMFRKEKEVLSIFSYLRGIKVEPAYEIKHPIPLLGNMWIVPRL